MKQTSCIGMAVLRQGSARLIGQPPRRCNAARLRRSNALITTLGSEFEDHDRPLGYDQCRNPRPHGLLDDPTRARTHMESMLSKENK